MLTINVMYDGMHECGLWTYTHINLTTYSGNVAGEMYVGI